MALCHTSIDVKHFDLQKSARRITINHILPHNHESQLGFRCENRLGDAGITGVN
jgi:hypothetical protein